VENKAGIMNKIKCRICDEKLIMITCNHLKKHNITLEEYKKEFPNQPTFSDDYYKHLIRISSIGGKKLHKLYSKKTKEWSSKGGKRTNELYPKEKKKWCSKGGLTGIKNIRKNKSFWFMNVPFDSPEEKEYAKLLHKCLGWIPEEGVTCHIQMNEGEIDFKIPKELIDSKEDVFIEHHTNHKKYYEKRRGILDKNNHKENELFVSRKLRKILSKKEKLPRCRRQSLVESNF